MQEKMHHHSMPQPSSSTRRTVDPNLRVYQVWKGNNRFFLGGRLVFGPDVRSLMFTIFLIATPVISFCVFESQRLINGFHHHLGVLIVTLPAVFTVYIVILLLLTSGRDPGIIPRNLHPPEQEDEGATCIASEWPGNRAGVSAFRPSKDVLVNGVIIKVKYCQTCMLYRPPRCSHCSICNNCVERFDHHCPWVGQCIGKRNYRYFFLFVSSTTMLCLYVFAFCWINIHLIMGEFHCSLGKAFLKSPVSVVLIIYTFIAAWFVGGLTAFHVYLISTNQTTYENFRYRYDGKINPYNRGLPYNIWEVFFSKIPTSKSNFRSKLNENAVLPISSSMAMGCIMSPELPKKSTDIEMGGKRKAVVEEEFEDIQNQIEGGNRLERCNTPPRHANWTHKANCEITIEKEHREKITGVL